RVEGAGPTGRQLIAGEPVQGETAENDAIGWIDALDGGVGRLEHASIQRRILAVAAVIIRRLSTYPAVGRLLDERPTLDCEWLGAVRGGDGPDRPSEGGNLTID